MNRKQHFEKHYSKLRFEAWFNSALYGFIVGLFSGFVVALVYWFLAMNGLWLSIGVVFGVAALTSPIFYFAKFRPNVVKNARRLDRLGLEERLVTMVEYENDDSFIAKLQREDAKANLTMLDTSAIKLVISNVALILTIVSSSLFVVMNTLETLGEAGLIPNGEIIVDALTPEEQIEYFEVIYEVDGGGEIYGESIQLIPKGEKTEEVVAVADDEWIFSHWEEDEYKKPARSDGKVTENLVFTAVFIQTGDGDQTSDQDDPNAEPSDDGKPKDKPDQSQNKDQQNQDKQEQEDQKENENEDQQQKPDENEENKPTNQGGSRYEEANKVIDGEKYYKDEIEDTYYEELRQRLEEDGDQLTEEERHLIESYLDTLRGSKNPTTP